MNNNQEIQNNLSQNNDLNQLTGKVNFNSYCFDKNCKKDIGILNINNKNFKLSVELENLNTNNVSGKIILGNSELNISELSHIDLEKVFNGFEVYNDYFILYMSSLDTMKNQKTSCELRGYIIYILNSNLDQVSEIAGYTKNNAFKDFKIENGILYYYALTFSDSDKYQSHLTYNKIDFNYLLNKNYDNNIFISSFDECGFGQLW